VPIWSAMLRQSLLRSAGSWVSSAMSPASLSARPGCSCPNKAPLIHGPVHPFRLYRICRRCRLCLCAALGHPRSFTLLLNLAIHPPCAASAQQIQATIGVLQALINCGLRPLFASHSHSASRSGLCAARVLPLQHRRRPQIGYPVGLCTRVLLCVLACHSYWAPHLRHTLGQSHRTSSK
jgi:hypothetical protein